MSYKKRSKQNNQFKIDHAWPGICSLCYDEIATYNGSDINGKPIILKFKSNFKMFQKELSDGSVLTTSLCSDCYDNITEDDYTDLMSSELRGWKKEIKMCIKDRWTKTRKEIYLDKYSKLTIKAPMKAKCLARADSKELGKKLVKEGAKDGINK